MRQNPKHHSAKLPAIISESQLEGFIAHIHSGAENSDVSEANSIEAVFASRENEDARAVEAARTILRLYRKRALMFSGVEFSDPAWMILLSLFTNGEKAASVNAVCAASGAAPTTALRYIARLEEARLIVRNPHPFDLRAIELRLTAEARQGLIDLFC